MPGRFSWLLLAILGLFVVTTAIAEWRTTHTIERYATLVQVLERAAYAAVLLAAGRAVVQRKLTIAVAWLLALAAIGSGLMSSGRPGSGWALAESVATAAFLGFTFVLVVRHLFRCREVDLDTLAAAICVYLLFALLWLAMYSVVVHFDPSSFSFPPVDRTVPADDPASEEPEQMTLQSTSSAHGLYFSLVTLTTLGYGDITPQSPIARLLAALQAAVGQVYLTVLVARLVGLHLSTRVRDPEPNDDDLLGPGDED